jgi:hypothetical protein
MKNILYLSSPEFRILQSPENGENKNPEFGLKIKVRKWDIKQRIAK